MDPGGPSQVRGSGAPPPPLPISPAKAERSPIVRRDHGRRGQKVPLLTNHFGVSMNVPESVFFHYSVRPTHFAIKCYCVLVVVCVIDLYFLIINGHNTINRLLL